MSLSQIGFFVIPKASLNDFSLQVDEDGCFDDVPFWRIHNIATTHFLVVEKILPKGKSWDQDRILFGSQDSNRFEVLFENNFVTSVSFRIDFTTSYEDILNGLIEFFILNGLAVLDENLNVLPLNFEAIKSIIENSPQVKIYKKLSNK